MRRSTIVLASTAAGTAGILGFHARAPQVQTTAAAAAPTATPTATSSSGESGTATGSAVDTQYGPAQVRVTVRDGRIVKLQALRLQGNDPRSYAISSYAAPILQREVLRAQSTAVDAVSGASYTSASYLESVQSALDKLGFR